MKTTRDFDLSFRPEKYWEHGDPFGAILSGIKGQARRQSDEATLTQVVLEAPKLRANGAGGTRKLPHFLPHRIRRRGCEGPVSSDRVRSYKVRPERFELPTS